MSQHTPGPWLIEQRDCKYIEEYEMFIYGQMGKLVLSAFAHRPKKADICLIAAAPDLLEALESLANVAVRNTDDCEEWEAVIAEARAAIAKAKGETK